METRIAQYPPRQSTSTYNHPFGRHNVQSQLNFTMPMPLTDIALRRIIPTPFQFRVNRHRPKSFSLTSINVDAMADESTNNHISSQAIELNPDNKSKDEKEKASGKPIPPPPEKPLPGDCCGSGCVRCVWDVYYEELDEYERLYKSNSKSC